MATEIVTAKAGTNHVDSEDIGALYAGGFGKGRYALDLGNGLKCSMRNANTLVIDTGGIMFDGRFVRVKTVESLTVTNGMQSQYRKDLAVLTYKRDASNNNIESVSWSVLRGTPASSESAAKAPTLTEGSILDGDATASVAVAEVDLAGLTPTCKLLLPTVTSLVTLGDSVSPVTVPVVPEAGLDGGAVRCTRSGNVATCVVEGSTSSGCDIWGTLTLATGLPVPASVSPYSQIVAQNSNNVFMMCVSSAGELFVQGKGTSSMPAGWVFGSITYVCR